jgi:hypothetical protein
LINIQKVNADNIGAFGIAAQVPPNFQIAFDKDTAVITTNMKVIVNGQEASQK